MVNNLTMPETLVTALAVNGVRGDHQLILDTAEVGWWRTDEGEQSPLCGLHGRAGPDGRLHVGGRRAARDVGGPGQALVAPGRVKPGWPGSHHHCGAAVHRPSAWPTLSNALSPHAGLY